VDLPVPPGHFADPGHADRALAASGEAMGLAAELAKLTEAPGAAVVVVMLPRPVPTAAVEALAREAERWGCEVADQTWPMGDGAAAGGAGAGARMVEGDRVGVSLDAAAMLMAGGDPAAAVHAAGERLVQARWSDAASGARVAVGSGRLDVLAFGIALELTAAARRGPRAMDVVDARGLAEAAGAIAAAAAVYGQPPK
jgi:sugar phosphate isomerase/epimerase